MKTTIPIKEKLLTAVFLHRPNRFLARVRLGSQRLYSFVPNPGRMSELLQPGKRVLLRKMPRIGRKTQYDLIGVCHKNQVICVDSRIPSRLVHYALEHGDIAELDEYTGIRAEFKYDHVRFDFLLNNHSAPCLLEVKSCTLVQHGTALFPDAVTRRGRRQVEKLAEPAARGYRGCVLFVVQRTDASVFSPDYEVDPRFGAALCKAAQAGVDVYAYYSEFAGTEIALKGKLEVQL